MARKRLLLLGCAALLGVLLTLPQGLGAGGLFDALSFFGDALRALSLSGFPGNLAAWGLVYLLSSPPILWMLRQRRGQGRRLIDLLPVLSSLLIGCGLFALANPTMFARPIPEYPQVWAISFWTAALSALVCWLVLLGLGRLEQGDKAALARALSALLLGAAALMVFSAVYGGVTECVALIRRSEAGNTSSGSGALDMALFGLSNLQADAAAWNGRTAALLWVLTALDMIPSLLGAAVLLWGAELAAGIRAETFGEETVALCERTARGCRRVAAWSVALSVCGNLLQLALMPYVARTSFSVKLPLFTLLLSAALFLLCRCFQRGRELQQDSDSII